MTTWAIVPAVGSHARSAGRQSMAPGPTRHGPAGELGPDRDVDLGAGRHDVELLAFILADAGHLPAAARALRAGGQDLAGHPRQAVGQRAPATASAPTLSDRILARGFRLAGIGRSWCRRVEQAELIRAHLLRGTTEGLVTQDRQEGLQAFVLQGQHRDPTLQRGDPLERIILRVRRLAVVPGIIHVKKVSVPVLVVKRSKSSNIKVTETSVQTINRGFATDLGGPSNPSRQ